MPEDTQEAQGGFRSQFKGEISKLSEEEQRLANEGAPIQDNVWQLYEGRTEEYEGSFNEIIKQLGLESFRGWMRQRKEAGLTTHILDVMGGNGTFLNDLSKDSEDRHKINPDFDKSLVVTLADETIKRKRQREENARRGVSILAGDVTSGKTWHDVTEWMKSEGVPGFDLVVCRGVDGIRYIPIPLYRKMLDEFYSRATNSNGLILSQVSYDADEKIDGWNTALNTVPGIKSFVQHERTWGKDSKDRVINYFSFGAGFPAVGILKTDAAPKSIRPFVKNLSE